MSSVAKLPSMAERSGSESLSHHEWPNGRDSTDWDCISRQMRRIVLEQSKRANVGHIGSALSVADILAALYGGVLHVADPDDPERDRFILSKGHAALALYAALSLRGWITEATWTPYCGRQLCSGVHPEHQPPRRRLLDRLAGAWLVVRRGRGAGGPSAALARGASSCWSATPSATRARSGKRSCSPPITAWPTSIAIIDLNGQQALGYTDDVLALSPLAERWRAFGWDVHEVDGHDVAAHRARPSPASIRPAGQPHVLVAHTDLRQRRLVHGAARSGGTTCRCPTPSTTQALRGDRSCHDESKP